MQKIDFVINLENIAIKLKSNDILKQFNAGFIQPGQNFDYGAINPLLFLSKSNYDQIKDDERYSEILTSLNAQNIYTENNLSHLTTILRPNQANSILTKPNAVALFNFHNTVVQSSNLSKNILQSKSIIDSSINEVNNGVVIFQVLIEGEGLETEQYINPTCKYQFITP